MLERKKIRVLLADDNKDFCDLVAGFLRAQEDIDVIETVYNGVDAYERILAAKPDVALLDGAMPGLDGLGVLERLRDHQDGPVCIMLSGMSDDSVTQRAHELGAKYYIIKPFELNTLADRIRMFQDAELPALSPSHTNTKLKSGEKNLEQQVTDILHEFGFAASNQGYHYLRTAIILAVNNPDILHNITKELYPGVAREYNTEPSKVERAIRYAIEAAWDRGYMSLAGYDAVLFSKKWKPKNSEFIAHIADKLRLEMSLP